MQYRNDKHGEKISMLGYGCMRFTKKGAGIDLRKAEREILTAYKAGVNYYDTAYIYPGSEEALGKILAKHKLRERVNIATKLPQYLIRNREALDKYFNEELSRLRTDYVDYYLMHHLTDVAMWEKLKAVGILKWIEEKKASGQIRNIGFSYHGNTENFLTILDDYAFFFHMYSDDQYSDRLSFNFTKGNHVLTYTQSGNNGIHLSGTLEKESFDMDLYAQGSDKKDRLSKTIVSIFEKLEKINNS